MRTEIKHVLKSMSPLLIEVPKKLSSPSLIGSSHKLQTNERRNSFADYFNRSVFCPAPPHYLLETTGIYYLKKKKKKKKKKKRIH